MSGQPIICYAQEWHFERSNAFDDLFTEPISSYADIEMHSWDGKFPLPPLKPNRKYVFCQLVPPTEWLQKAPGQIVWLPMWDHVFGQPQRWWNALPKSLRLVAFSDGVYHHAVQAGLKTLRLQYYKNPEQFAPVDWSNGRVLLYWNRTGLIGPRFLEQLCRALKVDKLLFRSQTDPNYQNATFELSSSIGNTLVETLPVFQTRQEYLEATKEANIFIAPRPNEGVGMAFLEAMARGCMVFAHNRPTMNEYISSGENGYLFTRKWTSKRVLRGIRTELAQHNVGNRPAFEFLLRENDQNWDEISMLNIESMGQLARQQQSVGYETWHKSLEAYVRFILAN